ncbi:MAG: aspartate kinase [Flavobacteriales bacterium]
MKVFKFGGASVKDAEAIRNVGSILLRYELEPILVVVSAMGKTTNNLESCLRFLIAQDQLNYYHTVDELRAFHEDIAGELFHNEHSKVFRFIDDQFEQLKNKFEKTLSDQRAYEYDQIVSLGEVLSSFIINEYILELGLKSAWLDARRLIRTDNHYQEANVNWEKSEALINSEIASISNTRTFITQGFIGHTPEGFSTTLGREGSDYSAAIFAFCLNASEVTIWKDVPGMLNADPKYFENTQLLSKISYREAIELAYFGASVIHPKTIKPLQNKGIPLFVKSFISPDEPGTTIQSEGGNDHLIPSFIVKKNQVLITISSADFSFINEDALAKIFEIFYSNRIKINLMQNSALNFSVLVDGEKVHMETLIAQLRPTFNCKYNEEVELVTIRHYNQATIHQMISGRDVLLEQRSRQTARFVIR